MSKRYFLVSYFFSKKNNQGYGQCDVTTNGYINRSIVVEDLKKLGSFDNVIILNIIELSENDLLQYTLEPNE